LVAVAQAGPIVDAAFEASASTSAQLDIDDPQKREIVIDALVTRLGPDVGDSKCSGTMAAAQALHQMKIDDPKKRTFIADKLIAQLGNAGQYTLTPLSKALSQSDIRDPNKRNAVVAALIDHLKGPGSDRSQHAGMALGQADLEYPKKRTLIVDALISSLKNTQKHGRSRWTLAPTIGEVPSSSERATCIALTQKNSTIKKRGQLLSFLFAVAPNRTMSL
jgi:hypothetical protein